MKHTPHLQQDDIYQQAAQWLDKLADGPLDSLSKRRFCNWLDASEAHAAVFNAMLATWQDPSLEQAIKLAKQQRHWRHKLYDWLSPPLLLSGASLAAAALLLVLLYPVTVSQPQPTAVGQFSQQFSTAKAEQQDHTLVDGSVIEMGADSAVQVAFVADRRAIELQKGAAYFDVASDKSRPFEVRLGEASVVAVGTEFNIDRGLSGSDVTVYEGAIEVRARPGSPPTLLKAGESIHIGAEGLSRIEAVDLHKLVDWRSGWIEIKNQPLSYLVERLNRQSNKQITLAETNIAHLPVAGRFQLRDTAHTLALLGQVYNLTVSDSADSIVVAYRHQ